MKKLLPGQYAKILYELTVDKKGKELEDALDAFVRFLRENQSATRLPYILKAFERYAKEKEGMKTYDIVSARELSEGEIKKILSTLGTKGEVTQTVDPVLLGGVIIKDETKIIDASLRTQLSRLKWHIAQ